MKTVTLLDLDLPNDISSTRDRGLDDTSSARDRGALIHPMTDLVRHEKEGPLIIDRGEGCFIEDIDGRRYLEAVSGLWSVTLGFSQERLARAAYEQMMRLPSYHMFRFKSHMPAIELAERLLAMAPAPFSKVFFANSGSEAADTAMKLVWYYNNALGRPQKKKIIARNGGYHGVTIATASLTGLARNHADFDLPIDRVLHTECPHFWRYGRPGETEEDFATRLADSLEQLILKEGADTIAAFFAEPVMGSGGVIVPPSTYWEKIQAVLKRYDVLLVADEVICGFGRLGAMFGSQLFDMKPDMMTCAKGLSSGYLPISALLISEPIWRACLAESAKIGVFGHGFTYSGHPVCAAVALETLKIYEELDIVQMVRDRAPQLQDGLRRLANHPLVGEVRGLGLVAAVEIVADKHTKKAFDPKTEMGLFVERRCQAHGVIVRALGDALTIAPPLIIEKGQIDQIVTVVGRALDEALEHA